MIPFVDLKTQYLSIKDEIDTAVLKFLESTQFVLGNEVSAIENAAQAHLAEYKGHRVARIGDIGCFSFYPGKNLGAYAELSPKQLKIVSTAVSESI